MNSQVAIARCIGYDRLSVQEALGRCLGLLGGITGFIKPSSRVLVKPNILMASEPESGIDTHPEVVRAVIKALKEIGCRVIVGDGPSVWGDQIGNIAEVYRRSGMKKVCAEEDVELVEFDKKKFRGEFPMTVWLDQADFLVNVPKFKTHELTLLTGAIKNLYGLVWGTFKTELHKNYFKPENFAKVVVDIFQQAPPAFTVVDGITAMEGDGPASGGKLRELNLLLAGKDCVAIDSVMAAIMGIPPESVLTTRVAAERNLGEADINRIEILGEGLQKAVGRPFKLPRSSLVKKIPQPLIDLAKNLIKYYPYVRHKNCIKCSACIDACPKQVVRWDRNKRIAFDYSGCIACFCCEEACPASAIKVKTSLFARLMGL
jgi:uncharacterized protein (DUF362 family)/Pyruvate/2-oxoacid:ferredoxin oxidoreductase delta subunit